MAQELTDKIAHRLTAPAEGNRIEYDSIVKGFGIRLTKAGSRAFILNYRRKGRERRITIGSFPDWTVKAARERAKALKQQIDMGGDPMVDRHEERAAPTVATLADQFENKHLPKCRPKTADEYKRLIKAYIVPALGKIKVADVRRTDGERVHEQLAERAPYAANRMASVLSKMFTCAVEWEMRDENPFRGLHRAPEESRERFLSPAEIERLAAALAANKEKSSANAIRLMLLTGARKGEVLKAKWPEIDLADGVWLKPSAHTKQKKRHRVPLSAPARALLAEMREAADKVVANGGKAEFLFPGDDDKSLLDVKRTWATVCKAAGLGAMAAKVDKAGKSITSASGEPVMEWKADTRIHDLRHTFASVLASRGLSLHLIGALLGHTKTQTTHRYAHLLDDPLREATEHVGAVVVGGPRAEVVQLEKVRA